MSRNHLLTAGLRKAMELLRTPIPKPKPINNPLEGMRTVEWVGSPFNGGVSKYDEKTGKVTDYRYLDD